MALRKAPAGLDPASLSLDQSKTRQWQEYACELVTPIYGGGVKAGEVDAAMPVRASAIRGQLRFWWRLLAIHKYGLSVNEAREKEFDIWGGLGDTPLASRVRVRVHSASQPRIEPWAVFNRNHRGEWKTLPDPEPWANAAYTLFPGQGKKPELNDSKAPANLVKPGLSWTLGLAFDWQPDDHGGDTSRKLAEDRVLEALRWWASFGGLGARTRRGLGSVLVSGLETVTQHEAEEAGCRLVLQSTAALDAPAAWMSAANKLRDFRQKPNFARNPISEETKRPGRSRWPEPDAIRRLTRRNHSDHKPVHPAGNLFPRAVFGLPIIFHFKDREDPADFALNPRDKERMASPLILRAYQKDEKWYPAALLLPAGHLQQLDLSMPNGSVLKAGDWWKPEMAAQVPPMANHGTDALSAFLHYFVGK